MPGVGSGEVSPNSRQFSLPLRLRIRCACCGFNKGNSGDLSEGLLRRIPEFPEPSRVNLATPLSDMALLSFRD